MRRRGTASGIRGVTLVSCEFDMWLAFQLKLPGDFSHLVGPTIGKRMDGIINKGAVEGRAGPGPYILQNFMYNASKKMCAPISAIHINISNGRVINK